MDSNHKILIDAILNGTNMDEVLERISKIEGKVEGILKFQEGILVSANEARKILKVSPSVIKKYEDEEVLINVSNMKMKKQFKLSEVFKLYELKKIMKGNKE